MSMSTIPASDIHRFGVMIGISSLDMPETLYSPVIA
jgi:hypothetical protein